MKEQGADGGGLTRPRWGLMKPKISPPALPGRRSQSPDLSVVPGQAVGFDNRQYVPSAGRAAKFCKYCILARAGVNARGPLLPPYGRQQGGPLCLTGFFRK